MDSVLDIVPAKAFAADSNASSSQDTVQSPHKVRLPVENSTAPGAGAHWAHALLGQTVNTISHPILGDAFPGRQMQLKEATLEKIPREVTSREASSPESPDQQYHPFAFTLPLSSLSPRRFTKEDKQRLEKAFVEESPKPSTSRKRQLAEELGCSLSKVNNWFQNRRAREKQTRKLYGYEGDVELELGDAELEYPGVIGRSASDDTVPSDKQSDSSSVAGSSSGTTGHGASRRQPSLGTYGPESAVPTSWFEAGTYANIRAHSESNVGDYAGELGAKDPTDEDAVQSVASMADAIGSTGASIGDLDQAAVNYIVAKLTGDSELLRLYTEATKKLSLDRFVANNRRLLKRLYLGISREGKTASQRGTATFLRSRRARAAISSDIFRTITAYDGQVLSPSNDHASYSLLEKYLSGLEDTDNSLMHDSNTSRSDDSISDDIDDQQRLLNTDTLQATGEYLVTSRAFAEYKNRFREFLYSRHGLQHEEGVPLVHDAMDIDVQSKSCRPDLNSDVLQEAKQVEDAAFSETNNSFGHDDESVGIHPQSPQGECALACDDTLKDVSHDERPEDASGQLDSLSEPSMIDEVVDLGPQGSESQKLSEDLPFLDSEEMEVETSSSEAEIFQENDHNRPGISPPTQISTTECQLESGGHSHPKVAQEPSLTSDEGESTSNATDAFWWRGKRRYSVGEPDLEDDKSDSMSVMSYIESIFGSQATRSTASSSSGDAPVLLSAFVNLLVRDPSVDRMFSRALSSNGIGQERFGRNFSRILRSYSRRLKRSLEEDGTHADDRAYSQAVAFVSRKSLHACNLIASRYVNIEQRPASTTLVDQDKSLDTDMIIHQLDALKLQTTNSNKLENYDSDDALVADEGSDEEQESLKIEILESFLASGEPFRLLKWKLRALVIPDQFLSRVEGSVHRLLGLLLQSRLPNLLDKAFYNWQESWDSFYVEIQKLIEELAIKLRTECHTPHQQNVADFVLVYSQYISAKLQEAMPFTTTLDSRRKDESWSQERARVDRLNPSRSEEILEDIVANTLPELCEADFAIHWDFLASTAAFAGLIKSLQDLAFPTLFSQAKKLIMEKNDEEGRRLLPILTELQWTVGRLETETGIQLAFRHEHGVPTIGDRVKLAVETSTGSEWDWWPLKSPPRHCNHDHSSGEAITWTCKCGALRKERISSFYAECFRELAEHYPLSVPSGGTTIPSSRPSSSLSNTGSQSSTNGSSSELSDAGGRSSWGSISQGSTSATTPSRRSSSVISVDDNRADFVFLLILRGAKFRLFPIEVTKMTARDFFQALINGYNRERGRWRRLFSIFVYSHCDFVKVKRYAPHRFDPGTKFAFPPCENKEYRYSPMPMLETPISPHVFYDLFYDCYDAESFTHRLHTIMSTVLPLISPCEIMDNPSEEFLDNLPKRDRLVDAGAQFGKGDKFEIFWGLVARERRSTARVILYTLLGTIPSMVFAFGWLFGWGHAGDLQNATVPLGVTCTIWGMLWAVVYSGSDIRDS